jgi:beta-N-acetylhexosaminidase
MTATSDRIITLRLVRLLLTLFAVGTGIGLVASTAVPLRLPASVVDVAVAEPAVDTVAVPADPLEPETSCLSAPLRQRAAQTLVVGIPDATTIDAPVVADVLELGVGGVFINDGNVVSAEQITTLISGMRARSVVDLLVTTDEEAGRVSTFRQIVGATSSPRTLAAHSSSEDVRTFARDLGGGLAALGLTSDLAPVADLDGGPAQGTIGDRAFSADPMVTAEYAQAFAAGLSDAGLIPVAKHFPGLGGAGGDVHRRSATVTTPLEQMLSTDVLPFVALVDAGIPVVMLSHASYEALDPRRPASLSPAAYALLRDLGFTGVAMTDSLGMGAIHRRWDFPEAAVLAVRAGADAVLATDGRQAAAMVAAIVAAVEDGTLPEQRLDEAVARMLALKGIDPQTLTCAPPVAVPAMDDAETALRR